MTDREYIELAAKAVAIKGEYGYAPDDYYYDGNVEGILTYLPNGQMHVWNPLTDDGDAFRLMVKLHICPAVDETAASAMVSLDEVSWCDLKEVSNDPLAATRRAIVRAAAEIGRNMK